MSELIAVPINHRVVSDSPSTVLSDLQSFLHKIRANNGRVTGLICSPDFLYQVSRAQKGRSFVLVFTNRTEENSSLMGIPIREVRDLVGLVLIAEVE